MSSLETLREVANSLRDARYVTPALNEQSEFADIWRDIAVELAYQLRKHGVTTVDDLDREREALTPVEALLVVNAHGGELEMVLCKTVTNALKQPVNGVDAG